VCVFVCVEVISRRNETKPALDGRAKSEKFLTLNDFFFERKMTLIGELSKLRFVEPNLFIDEAVVVVVNVTAVVLWLLLMSKLLLMFWLSLLLM
jgi:hypothetical protein